MEHPIFAHGFSRVAASHAREGIVFKIQSVKTDWDEDGRAQPVPWFERQDILPVRSARVVRVGFDQIVVEEVVTVGEPRRWLVDLDENRPPRLVRAVEGFPFCGVGKVFEPREIAVL